MSKSTLLEQSITMYSLDDSEVQYWKDWAFRFVNTCINVMGWEVEPGPGTSLGAVIPGPYNDSTWRVISGYNSTSWDCDWTRENGIVERWENTFHNNCPLYSGWFNGMTTWPTNSNSYGIDETTGRFDIIVYTAQNPSGEKIGFRIKYPVCSVGYSWSRYGYNESSYNMLYTVPIFSIYTNSKQNIELYYPSSNYDRGTWSGGDFDVTDFLFDGYIYVFGKSQSNFLLIQKTDINNDNNSLINSTTQLTSPTWNLECQLDNNFTTNIISGVSSTSPFPERLFKNHWKEFNKFNYQFSKDENTSYMYISSSVDNEVGFKVITTTLEDGEKVVMLESRRLKNSYQTLCENAGVTNTLFSSPSQAISNSLIKVPKRAYLQNVSGNSNFAFSKLLIPTTKNLCKDLYTVIKKDEAASIGTGVHVIVRDKNAKENYFKVIPFGSAKTYEVIDGNNYDNTTYLAFPVADPEKTIDFFEGD